MEYTPDLYARQPPQGEDGNLPRTYYLKPNQPGQGAHVRNCGYIVGEKARGKGIATRLSRDAVQSGGLDE